MYSSFRAVIIGGGITGCSIAYHLAKMGWREIVLLEKGELTSGTTFHSVGLVTQFRTSNALMRLQNYSIALYDEFKKEIGDALGWHQVGSLRLASSDAQYKNLQRNISRAKGLGLKVEMISPAEAKKIFPPMTDKNLFGAVYLPDDGWLDPNSITQELARRAKQWGAEISTGVRVTEIERDKKNRVCAVNTTHGRIETECVINAAGQWAPRIAEMVETNLPLTPLMHQYLLTRARSGHELPKQTPVVRDPDNLVYIREEAGGFLIGGFESNPKAWCVGGVDWNFSQQLLPPEWELFEELLQGAIRRVPEIENAQLVKLINGPDAMTPDGHYALGPVPTVPGMWVAAGMSLNGIAGAGGVGRVMAEWIVEGAPSFDVSEMNVRRFGGGKDSGAYLRDKNFVAEKAREAYRYYYLLRYPNDEDEWGREKRLSPLYNKVQEYGAVFGAKNGWERVNYYETTDDRIQTTDGRPQTEIPHAVRNDIARSAVRHPQPARGWDKPSYFGNVGAEHRAARERVALFDMTSFGKIDVRGAGAKNFLQHLSDNDIDKPIGSLTYTQFLNERGGIESDLTIARLDENHFRVITGTGFLASDLGWMELQRRGGEGRKRKAESGIWNSEFGEVELDDVTDEYACLGLWGPYARNVLEQVTGDDVSKGAFPYMTARWLEIEQARVWAQRVSYVGELGWELYCANDDAVKLWNALMEAGKIFGITPAGYKALETLRLEKCYRYWGSDITPGETPYESGQAFAVKLNKGDFIGRDALLRQKAQGINRKLAPLTFPLSFQERGLGGEVMIYGGEAIWYDDRVVSRVRSGGYGYTIAKNIALCYVPLELAQLGAILHVELFGERVPAVVSPDPLYDPQGEKLKA